MTLTHDPIPGMPAGQDPGDEPMKLNQQMAAPAGGAEKAPLASQDTLATPATPGIDRPLGQSALRWSADETPADTPVAPSKHRRFPLRTVAGATAVLVAGGGIYLATSGGGDKPEAKGHGPVATSPATAGEKSTSATANTSPSMSPSSLPSLGAGEHAPHTGLDITDLTSLPADIATEIVKVHDWEVHIPTSLVDPAKDPELFVKEFLTLDAVAGSVPADSALFNECLDILGHTDHTDRYSVDLKAFNAYLRSLTDPYSDSPPQLIYFNDTPLTVRYDEEQGTVSVMAQDGKSVRFAADAFPNDAWQDSAAKHPGEDQAVFPNGQLDQLVISITKSATGKIVVTKADTGYSETYSK